MPCLFRKERKPTEYEEVRDASINHDTEWGTQTLIGKVGYMRSLGTFFAWFIGWALATAVFVLLVAAPDSWKSPVTPSDPLAIRDSLRNWLEGCALTHARPCCTALSACTHSAPLLLLQQALTEAELRIWDYVGWIYPAAVLAHWLLTMRDGYIAGAHTVNTGAATCWTWVLNTCCGGFVNSCLAGALKSNETFIYTEPSTGWLLFSINVIFWGFVLAGKVCWMRRRWLRDAHSAQTSDCWLASAGGV